MSRSVASRASNASSKMLQELANRSQIKIYRVEGTFSDEEMRVIWNALGLYISRNLRMGRGVNIPKLGIFTFTPPEVRLKGVTNQGERDRQPRTPVFLIQKDFLKGVHLKTAIFYHQQFGTGLRPYSAIGATGQVPITKMNLIEVASYANMSKDATELGINRIIKYIGQKLLSGENVSLELPNLGQLISRNQLVAVKFNEYVLRDTRNVLAKSVDERKGRGNMSLTTDNLKKFANLADMSSKLYGQTQQFFDIDDHARQFLSSDFNIHMDDSNCKRSITNFDRSVASKLFDRTNKSLKDSHSFKASQSAFFSRYGATNKEFNMALRIIREWIRDHGHSSVQAYNVFCNLAGKKTNVLTQNDVWNACKQISVDITEQMGHELFRIMDNNKDGLITLEDWNKNIHFDHNNSKFKELLLFLRQKKYSLGEILAVMGLEGVRKVSTFSLKNGLMKLWPGIQQEEALLLSKFIAHNKEEIEVQRIIDALNIKQKHNVDVDDQWENHFLSRLKRKLQEHNMTQELLSNKFRLFDKTNSGYIEQTDFKTVMGELGVNVSLNELIKLVKFIPINKNNHLHYGYVVDKLKDIQWDQQDKQDITQSQFVSVLKQVLAGKLPFTVPISVSNLTNLLQGKYFKNHDESSVRKFVRKIDINEDEEVGEDDLHRYHQMISDKAYRDLPQIQTEQLLVRFREKTIKKKISYYDVFRKLDKVGSGYITREGWLKNIGEIIQFSQDEKQNLFNYIDKDNNGVIQYKSFIAIMNGSGSLVQSEKFDWAEKTLENIKEWYRGSKLTAEDAFKVLDKDGDTYLNEKDLQYFLVSKLKLQDRELNNVRIQKLIKIMDSYKHGRITYIDWTRLINESKDWLSDAKQQIGIVLSKHYASLSQAYYNITKGDQKLLFVAFDKWIKSNHILSGFIINEDMLQFIFRNLDQHKKGYLLESDFVGLFGGYDWKSEHVKEFNDFVKVKFGTCEEAYRYIAEYSNKTVDFQRFKQVLGQFFGSRFQPSDCQNIWKSITGGRETLDLSQFKKLNGHLWLGSDSAIDKQFPKDSWKYQDFSIIKGTTVRSKEHQYEEKEKMESQCQKFINNLRNILASSPKTLEQAFYEVDKEKSGRVTNLMFKKAFRIMNIALTSKEIDLLLNYCDFKVETLIDWKQFIKQLDLNEDKLKIRARIQPRLQHISDLLHYYMISPKDAFRKWNNPRTGYLSFEEFHKMLKEVYGKAAEQLPQYQQIEDLFKFIDIRGDNQIDFQEFTQVFRNCNPPNLLMGTTPAPSDQVISKPVQDKQASLPIREKAIPRFRNSPAYEQFVQLIGRNRRYIQEQIQKSNVQKSAFIPFGEVQKVIKELSGRHGVAVEGEMVRNLIAFAMTGERVDYQLLVSKFKDLSVEISEFPKSRVF